MQRSFSFWRSWALVVGIMIGNGIFMLPAVLAPYGSLSLLGWFFAGGGTLFIALMLGSLARRIPKLGGPYAYTRTALGDLPGFLVAWGYWISAWAASAAAAVAFVGYFSVFVPQVVTEPIAGAAAASGKRKNRKSFGIAVGALAFSLFTIIGSGLEVAVYGLILLAAGLPIYC